MQRIYFKKEVNIFNKEFNSRFYAEFHFILYFEKALSLSKKVYDSNILEAKISFKF